MTPPELPADRSRLGALYEAYAASILSGLGWTVRRVGSSSNTPDFGADLLAFHPDDKDVPNMAVQCKYWQDRPGVEAVQAVYAAKDFYGAFAGIVLANNPLTEAGRTMAAKLSVRTYLVDVERWEPPAGLGAPIDAKGLLQAPSAPARKVGELEAGIKAAQALREHLKLSERWRLAAETLSIRSLWRVRVRWTRKQTFLVPGQVWTGTVDVDAATGETRVVESTSAYTPER